MISTVSTSAKLALGSAVLAAVVLVAWCSPKTVILGPSRDSALAADRGHQLAAATQALRTATNRADSVGQWAAHALDSLATARSRPRTAPRATEPGESPWQAKWEACETDLAQLQQDLAGALFVADSLRVTLAGLVDTAEAVLPVSDTAAQALQVAAVRIGALERRLATIPRWSAGPIFEPPSAVPVGGYLSRDVWRVRVAVELTDGANEQATVRLAIGWRF